MKNKTIRLIFPQWQGGNIKTYTLGAELLAFLAPKNKDEIINIPVSPYKELENENGIRGRTQIVNQLNIAINSIKEHNPSKIVTLGGDCLVSLAPFSQLSEKYKQNFGILWLDAHPDVMTPKEYEHSHSHVLGALMGNGDSDFTSKVSNPVKSNKILIAGINSPSDYESDFIKNKKIATYSPDEIKNDKAKKLIKWLKDEKITNLAIHFDLDVLDYNSFRNLYFSRPNTNIEEFDGIAKGKLQINEVVELINKANENTNIVGLTISEHLPWDMENLKSMLLKSPLLN